MINNFGSINNKELPLTLPPYHLVIARMEKTKMAEPIHIDVWSDYV